MLSNLLWCLLFMSLLVGGLPALAQGPEEAPAWSLSQLWETVVVVVFGSEEHDNHDLQDGTCLSVVAQAQLGVCDDADCLALGLTPIDGVQESTSDENLPSTAEGTGGIHPDG